MSVKCSGCGLVNFADAGSCRRCRYPLIVPLPAPAKAPATWVPAPPSTATPRQGERTLVGPFDTGQGLRAWYVVGLPDALIAVPLSLWPSMVTGVGTVVRSLTARRVAPLCGGGYRDAIADASEADLRSRPGALVFPIAELSAIAFKQPLLAASNLLNRTVTPGGLGGAHAQVASTQMRLRLKGRDQPVRLALSDPWDFPEFFGQLNARYPSLCRTEK
jgi:hypothetical protein